MNFDYGNVLTRAFQITWRHKSFWLLLMIPVLLSSLIFAVFVAPVFILDGNEDWMTLITMLWVGLVIIGLTINFLLSTLGMTSVVHGILRAERGEDSIAPIDLVRDSVPFFGRALGATLIIQCSVGAVFTMFFLCVTALSLVTMGLASFCLQPIFIVLTPFSFLMLAVIYGSLVAVIDEGLGAWEAVKRAIEVTREHVWKFIILSLIAYCGTSILTSIFMIPVMLPVMAGPVLLSSGIKISSSSFTLVAIPFVCIFLGGMSLISGVSGTFMAATLGISFSRLSRPIETVTDPATS
ncbi:MAG: hypothetical protein J0L96_12660 [Anaerolineae bacterium]|jgi:hypothetical protein|nr:hypothetical protein [Anaerolineae bacterium]